MRGADEPKMMAGHQATRRMAKCCVPNGVGEPRSLAKSMRVLNEARIRMKKKTLCRRDRLTRSIICIGTKNRNVQLENDQTPDGWVKAWRTTERRTRSRS
jgi:hypothetical protein